MADVKRYIPTSSHGGMNEVLGGTGGYVLGRDYDALAAERDALREENARLRETVTPELAVAIINGAYALERREFTGRDSVRIQRQQVAALRAFAGPIIDAENARLIAKRDATGGETTHA